ncbi:sortase [Plantibacter sp. RU18]|uniref:sortase n=1 Tax=Plantibacter sp. RU18 TaxID=3158143 RepID=UPI003D366DF2
MFKKILVSAALLISAIFLAPAGAGASYVPRGEVTVTGNLAPGGVVDVSFSDGSFLPGEGVTFSVSGSGTTTLAAFRTAIINLAKNASVAGAASVSVTLPADANGSYAVAATGLTTQRTYAATITTSQAGGRADPGADAGGLPDTGFASPAVIIWGATGIVALGAALVFVLNLQRRQNAATRDAVAPH